MIGLGNLSTPYPVSALPPVMAYASARMRLALKLFRGEPAISEFDWNFSAIHSSSHAFSTATWFGPPRGFTLTSTCSWIGHPVSGLGHATPRFSHSVSLRLRTSKFLTFAAYSNSPDRSTKSTTSRFESLCVLVNARFQVLFHSPPGVLFTFPSQYYSLSLTE